MPRQPWIALLGFAIIGTFVKIQLGYNVFHQLRDVSVEPDLLRVFAKIIADILSNHLLFEPLLNGLFLFSMITLCRQLILQMKLNKKWKIIFDSKRNPEWTEHFRKKFNKEKLLIEVITDSSLIAITVRFIRPKVVLSTGLIERFNEQELKAIVLHELYHSKFRHPLQMLILTLIAESLAFLPIMKSLVHHYKIWMELLADRFAICHMGSETQLAHVLLAVLNRLNPRLMESISFFKQKTLILSVIVLVLMTIIFIYGSV